MPETDTQQTGLPVDMRCDSCNAKIKKSWKFCGKCGSFLMPKLKSLPMKVRKISETDDLRESYHRIVLGITEAQQKYKREKTELQFALTCMEVDNGLRTETCYDELLEKERGAARWAKPPDQHTPLDMSYFEDIVFPVRPPRPVLQPLTHIHYNKDTQEPESTFSGIGDEANDLPAQDDTRCWFWGEPKLSAKVPINVVWNQPQPKPPLPEPEPVEIPVDPMIFEKQQEEEEKRKLLIKLDSWPNVMGKRFRRCVNSMRGHLRMCDVNVIDFQQKGRMRFLTDLLESLLDDIHTTKNVTHIINQEQMLFYTELEEFRVKVSASLAATLEEAKSKDDITDSTLSICPNWDSILATETEDKQRDEVDTIMKIRFNLL